MQAIVPIDCIEQSPWQAREDIFSDARTTHVFEVAKSIARNGMMQVPVGRLVDKDGKPDAVGNDPIDVLVKAGWKIQLAFGNTRLAAYRLLHLSLYDATMVDMRSQIDPGETWERMPVNVIELTDQQMFELGVEENVARKNLTPIEEALAMARYRDEFGQISKEIGKLFHLSDSGVRNKMRLLKLPEDIKNCLRRGEMAEGVARELLALVELPEDVRLAAEDDEEFIRPSVIIEAAKSGSSQKAIADMVTKFMEHIGKRTAKAPVVEVKKFTTPEPAPPIAEENAGTDFHFDAEIRAWAAHEEDRSPQATPAPAPTVEKPEWAERIDREMIRPGNPADQVPDPRYTTPTQSGQTAVEEEPEILAEETAQEPEPEPAPAAATPTWEGATISLTVTFWPDDGNPDGRMAMVGARANQSAPTMRMFRESQLALGEQLADLLEELKTKHFGGTQ